MPTEIPDASEPSYAYLSLFLIFFGAAFLAFGLAWCVGKIQGKRELRHLISRQRQRLSVVRMSMRVGFFTGTVFSIIFLALFIGGLVAWGAYACLGDWSQGSGLLAAFSGWMLDSWGTWLLGNNDFVPWGCIGAFALGIIVGAWPGIALGRRNACGDFDLTKAIYRKAT